MLCPHYINTCILPLLMLQWCHMVRLRSTLAQAMAWCLTAPSHHSDQHWHLISDIDQHWPRPWHVTWRHQATTQDQWWDIITGICQHSPRPWHVTARCQATTWANAEITLWIHWQTPMAVLTQTPEVLFPEINLKNTFNTSTVSTMFETSQYNKFEKCYSLMDLKVKKNLAILQTFSLKNLS